MLKVSWLHRLLRITPGRAPRWLCSPSSCEGLDLFGMVVPGLIFAQWFHIDSLAQWFHIEPASRSRPRLRSCWSYIFFPWNVFIIVSGSCVLAGVEMSASFAAALLRNSLWKMFGSVSTAMIRRTRRSRRASHHLVVPTART